MGLATVLLGDLTIPGQIPHVDEFGVAWGFQELVGWWDGTESSGGVVKNQFSDGGWYEPSTENQRALVLNGSASGDPDQMSAAIARLKANIPRTPEPFAVVDSQRGPEHVIARKEGLPSIKWDGGRNIRYSIQLVAADQRIFSGDGQAFTYTASTGLPTSTGGLQVPRQMPLQVAATTVSGSVTVTNAGDARPPVRVTIAGPVVNPVIRSAAGGLMQFAISLDAGQSLVVDLDKRTVKINGTVNRRNTLSGSWIVPSAGTVLSFDASSYNASAQMSVQWSDAWS